MMHPAEGEYTKPRVHQSISHCRKVASDRFCDKLPFFAIEEPEFER